MSIDKSWMQLGKSSVEYDQGVTTFLDYAYSHDKWVDDDMIICPCIKCGFRYRFVRSEVNLHLLKHGIKKRYTYWYLHGEDDDSDESDN